MSHISRFTDSELLDQVNDCLVESPGILSFISKLPATARIGVGDHEVAR